MAMLLIEAGTDVELQDAVLDAMGDGLVPLPPVIFQNRRFLVMAATGVVSGTAGFRLEIADTSTELDAKGNKNLDAGLAAFGGVFMVGARYGQAFISGVSDGGDVQVTSEDITDATETGRALLTSESAADARRAIGLTPGANAYVFGSTSNGGVTTAVTLTQTATAQTVMLRGTNGNTNVGTPASGDAGAGHATPRSYVDAQRVTKVAITGNGVSIPVGTDLDAALQLIVDALTAPAA